MKKKKYQCPICIVGAGPAGLTASLFLSKWGIKHLVIDKNDTFPRDKVCGESFDGRVTRILNTLSPAYLKELDAQGITSRTWRYGLHVNGAYLRIGFPKTKPPKLQVRRLKFDDYLYRRAVSSNCARIIQGQYITGFEQKENALVLSGSKIEIESQMAILANGAQGALTPGKRSASMIFGRTYYRNIIPRPENEIELYFFSRPVRGCMVICPLAHGDYNVEVGFAKQDYQQCRRSFPDILNDYIAEVPDLRARFAEANALQPMKGASVPMLFRPNRCADHRLILAGANTFSVNPISGMGVGNAMTMGKLAAETARRCVEKNDFSGKMTKTYERAVKRKLRNIIRLNWILNFFTYNVHRIEWLLPHLLRNPLLIRILNQSDLVHQIFNPRFYLKSFYPFWKRKPETGRKKSAVGN